MLNKPDAAEQMDLRDHRRRLLRKAAVPVAILFVGIVLAVALSFLGPTPEQQLYAPPPIPIVQVIEVQPQAIDLSIYSQGIVAPRAETDLISEVSGRVIKLAPSFAVGGFFKEGEVLLSIDPLDYEVAVVKAEATVAEARKMLLQERAESSEANSQERGEVAPSDFMLRKPHLAEAEARFAAAEASLRAARVNLERTKLRAPYDGRVREKKVDIGQYITQGASLARLYAVDVAEVRLPVSLADLAYLDLVLGAGIPESSSRDSAVKLTARVAGETHQWEGRIVRTEGVVDEKTGMLHLIAAVKNPYSQPRIPFVVGLFVQAEIQGRRRTDAYPLPTSALHGANRVLVVDDENHVRFRSVDIFRNEATRVLVHGGLKPGDTVIVSGIQVPIEGMSVRVASKEQGVEPVIQ